MEGSATGSGSPASTSSSGTSSPEIHRLRFVDAVECSSRFRSHSLDDSAFDEFRYFIQRNTNKSRRVAVSRLAVEKFLKKVAAMDATERQEVIEEITKQEDNKYSRQFSIPLEEYNDRCGRENMNEDERSGDSSNLFHSTRQQQSRPIDIPISTQQ